MICMELKIRNVDPKTVSLLDKLAKEKKMSRSSYLRILLNNFASLNAFNSFEERYKNLVDKSLAVIENNSKALQKIHSVIEDEEE